MPVAADAEQALLQVAIGGQLARIDQPVDAAVDDDGDGLGHGGGNADVLLDDEHGDLAVLDETNQDVVDLRHDHGRQALGRLVHQQQTRIEQEGTRDGQHLLLSAGEL